MFSREYLEMFKSTVIKYMDDEKIFGYCPFTNRNEQLRCGILSSRAKVIIFDTRTSYINATQLVQDFRLNPSKEFSKLKCTKNFKEILDHIEQTINLTPSTNRKYVTLPNYDTKDKQFKAMYLLRPSCRNVGYAGTYVHPDLIIHILIWCNYKLASELSRFITSILLHEGANENITLETELEHQITKLSESLQQKNSIIDALKAENKQLLRELSTPDFDIIQYQKTLNYLADLKEENLQLKKSLSTLSPSINEAILIVDNYDDDKCKYGSRLHKLTIMLIMENELERYVKLLSKEKTLTEEEIEQQLIDGRLKFKTDILLKIVPLRNVDPEFLELFVSKYEDAIDMWIEKDKNKSFLMTTDVKAVKDCLVEFTGEWQVI